MASNAKEKGGDFLVIEQKIESIKDMDQKELEEELPRLREEAVKAEEALRVAQQRLHEADHRMAKIPTFVEVHDDHLVVDRRGWDKMFRLMGRLTIPLDHVVRAEASPPTRGSECTGSLLPR